MPLNWPRAQDAFLSQCHPVWPSARQHHVVPRLQAGETSNSAPTWQIWTILATLVACLHSSHLIVSAKYALCEKWLCSQDDRSMFTVEMSYINGWVASRHTWRPALASRRQQNAPITRTFNNVKMKINLDSVGIRSSLVVVGNRLSVSAVLCVRFRAGKHYIFFLGTTNDKLLKIARSLLLKR